MSALVSLARQRPGRYGSSCARRCVFRIRPHSICCRCRLIEARSASVSSCSRRACRAAARAVPGLGTSEARHFGCTRLRARRRPAEWQAHSGSCGREAELVQPRPPLVFTPAPALRALADPTVRYKAQAGRQPIRCQLPVARYPATMNDRPHLLIVDEIARFAACSPYLGEARVPHHHVADGREMRRVMERSHVDCWCSIHAAGEDGLSLCRELRNRRRSDSSC